MRSTRIRASATAAALAASTLLLTACGGGSNAAENTSGGEDSTSSIDGAYLSATYGDTTVLSVDGNSVTVLDVVNSEKTCDITKKALKDIKNGSLVTDGDLNDGIYEVAVSGTMNDGHTNAVWTDEGSGSIDVGDDMITVEDVFDAAYDEIKYVPADSDQGKAVLDDLFCNEPSY